ncbi:glycosyltransferase family 2 protein [Streptomyces sp. NBC_01497]|nr:glycosyltransferase family A protein [Streptomyces sp. NBC_01497]
MPRRIDVITAVHAPSARYLADAYRSLRGQRMPEGWEWHWLIQQDGDSDTVAPYVPADPRVSFHQGRPGGPGTARTLALAHAHGPYVRVLDADDQLPPGALARDILALEGHADIGWTTSRALDLLPDGSTVSFETDPAHGRLEPGGILAHWAGHDHRLLVHPATLCVRRELLLALGGWMALPASEDTGLLLALEATGPGWFTREPGLLYRKWPGQVTGQRAHADKAEWQARTAVVEARARALARLYPRGPVPR